MYKIKYTEKNNQKAFEYLYNAAMKGNNFAFGRLGTFYFHGVGTNKNYKMAYTWCYISDLTGKRKHPLGIKAEKHLSKSDIEQCKIDGQKILQSQLSGAVDQAQQLGEALADQLLEMGAGEILSEVLGNQ